MRVFPGSKWLKPSVGLPTEQAAVWIRTLCRGTGDGYLGRAENSCLLITLCLNSWLFWNLAWAVFTYIWDIFPQKILSELVYFWGGRALMKRLLAEYWVWELLLSDRTTDCLRSSSQRSVSTASRPGEREILKHSANEENTLFWAKDMLGWVVNKGEKTTTFHQHLFIPIPMINTGNN